MRGRAGGGRVPDNETTGEKREKQKTKKLSLIPELIRLLPNGQVSTLGPDLLSAPRKY